MDNKIAVFVSTHLALGWHVEMELSTDELVIEYWTLMDRRSSSTNIS